MERKESNKTLYKKGLAFAVSCSVLWGVLPIYWHALRPIDSTAILLYRIFLVWLVCFLISLKKYGLQEIKKHLKPKGARLKFFLTGLLITFNWHLYVWAVNADQVIQTCVGYYIEPLVIGLFGIVLFKEKLTKYKLTALGFAIAGLIVILIHFMEVPLIALTLGVSFAGYAALKKNNQLPAALALLYETMYLAVPALAGIVYLEITGRGAIGVGTTSQYFLTLLSGPITALTLALFSEAANKVSMVTLGLLEYIMPSISLVIGIFLFKEPFDFIQFIAFVIVWIGLVFFTVGEMRQLKSTQPEVLKT